jgi:murein DD-endopeptidase MepM/ murein hydrolase activator NlpD
MSKSPAASAQFRQWLTIGSSCLLVTATIISPRPANAESLCPAAALDRLIQHRVAADDTLDSIARRYRLIPATIMGFNPSTRSGSAAIGSTLIIPPFNGIQIDVPAGMTLKALAAKYRVRADVLFELNGCQPSPRIAFIPGVNWSPSGESRSAPIAKPPITLQYPLPTRTEILLGYGWKLRSAADSSQVALHSGIDLAATQGTAVLAAGDGTVAFVGEKDNYGQLVVINHAQGYQTRYAQLASHQVTLGQTVRSGQTIGTVGQTGQPSSPTAHLHFELRSNSKLGWVAEDPTSILK